VAGLLVNGKRDQALSLLVEQALPGQNEILGLLTQAIEFDTNKSKALSAQVNQKLDGSELRFGAIILIFISLILFMFFYIFRSSRKEQNLLQTNLLMQKEISRQLEVSTAKLSQFTDALSTFTFMLSPEGQVELANKAAANSLGVKPQDFNNDYFFDCHWWRYSQEVTLTLKKDIQRCALGEKIDKELEIQINESEFMAVRFILTPIFDHYGKVVNLVAEAQDITERKRSAEKISYQATHDSLTGLINRYEFEHRLSLLPEHAKAGGVHYVFYMDLDQFKIVNDTCGHVAGDELLRQLPALIQTHLSKNDTLARLGGDEFGIILENSHLETAIQTAKLIIESINDYQFYWGGRAFRIGVSIGLLEVSNNMAIDAGVIMKWTDLACYAAKDRGRNTYHLYRREDEQLLLREAEMGWVSRIEQALVEHQFVLYAQPIVAVNNEKQQTVKYEFLLRMQDQNGVIPPGAFLPSAERYGKMVSIDYWVFSKAIEVLSENPGFLSRIDSCSINLSAQSLTDDVFLNFLSHKLSQHPGLAKKICIEITETAVITNMTQAMHFIATLKEVGVRFALDDFGSGLSSFGYLKKLPVDYLKIDGLFVKDIAEDPIDFAMVKSIHEVGSVMGIQTIAEFVENDDVLRQLKIIGVDFAQGYGVGMPEPLADFLNVE
jgi:diguanylate cyclase (GGDEF)-like protein/PAS domain S-box-containing protein